MTADVTEKGTNQTDRLTAVKLRQTSCAGGRHNMPRPCNGSARRQLWARPAEPGQMSHYAPYQPAWYLSVCPMYATDVRQIDIRRPSSL